MGVKKKKIRVKESKIHGGSTRQFTSSKRKKVNV